MNKTIIKYGLYLIVTMAITMFIGNYFFTDVGTELSEVVGYASMILSMIFLVLGMLKYRDNELGGDITYWNAMKVGLLIMILPSVIFGILDVIYVLYIDPDFIVNYYSNAVEQMKASLPPAEFEIKFAEMESQKEMFSNPFFQFLVMGATVYMIGIATSLIAAFFIKSK